MDEKDEKVQMVLRVPYRIREQLRRLARDDRRSLSGAVSVLIEEEAARRIVKSAFAVASRDEPFGTEE